MQRNIEILHQQPKSAGVMLIAYDHVLFVKEKSSGKWGFPKGSIEKGETPEACWQRELLEETTLDIKKYQYRTTYRKVRSRYLVHTVRMYLPRDAFQTMKEEMDQKSTTEIKTMKWFTLEEASKMMDRVNDVTRNTMTLKTH